MASSMCCNTGFGLKYCVWLDNFLLLLMYESYAKYTENKKYPKQVKHVRIDSGHALKLLGLVINYHSIG